MFETLDLFQLADARMRHAGARQAVVAANIANSDTPGYRARDLAAFEDLVRRAGGPGDDLGRRLDRVDRTLHAVPGVPSPNGNTVSLEREMLRAVEVQRHHSRALSVYQASLGILRTSIGR